MYKTKTLALVAGIFLLHLPGLQAQQVAVSTFAETIRAEDLKKHLTYIASDELEGRDTGSEGQRKAAEYIVAQLKSYGLTPIVSNGSGEKSYYQPFSLYKKDWQIAELEVKGKNKVLFTDYFPNGLVHIPEKKELELVYLPYGLPTEYEKMDLKGKAIVFWEGSQNGDVKWVGNEGLRAKVEGLKKAGAICFFEISGADAAGFKTKTAERRAILSRYNRLVFEPTKDQETASPTFTVSQEMGAEMVGLSTQKLIEIRKAQKSISPKSKVTIQLKRGDIPVETMNVMGYLEGTDKKDEVVVISAHFDHVGKDAKGNIYNGADDDGSGTCAVLELAQAFSQAKAAGNGPRRSILFLWVTGEEKGLLGSKYFTDVAPALPLDNMVCNLNIDMIGRVDKEHAENEKYVYLIGSDKLSSELHTISEEANKQSVNYSLDYTFNDPKDPNRFYYRSDHYNFAKKGIPVIFYFTGVHEDYHQPGDDVEKIMFPKYQDIVRLVFHTGWEVSNRDKRIVVDSNKP